MGFSSVPREPTDQAYREAFEFAAGAADIVLIQRAPPWSEFVPGGSISERTERLTRFERDLARNNSLRLFLAIDVTDPADRGNLVALPDDLRGEDFSNGRVRAAFTAYAKYLALNYKPAYLALGVEVDMFFSRRGDAAFRNFQSLYFETYDEVKSVSPSTMVFPTFQYENLQGLISTGLIAQPYWALLGRFEPKIDAIAVSSFPGFVYQSVDQMPAGYYSELRARSQRPVLLASIGWTSDSPLGPGTADSQQLAYITRAMQQAESLQAEAVIWYLARDPEIATVPGFAPLAAMGLYDNAGDPKPAWAVWRTYLRRPLE
jgi:hypothetical protein